MNTEFDERRQRRRRRRIRNQIAAIIVFVAVLAAIAVGGFFGVRWLMGRFADYKQGVEEQLSADTAPSTVEVVDDPIVVEAPVEEESEPEPEVPTEDELLDEIVDTLISEMPLEDKVAGLFLVTPEQITGVDTAVKAGTGTKDALAQYAVGGLVYAAKNIKDSAQITDMLHTTISMSRYPIFTAVAESGAVPTVAKALSVDSVDTARTLAQNGDTDDALAAGQLTGKLLSDLGFNMDTAVEIGLSEDESSYGTDVSTAGELLAKTIEGLKDNGVDATLRLFPAAGDMGDGMVTVELTEEELEAVGQMVSAGVSAGAAMVCVSNVSVPSLTGDNTPCDLSAAVVTDILRDRLGYDGIVVTDALDDKAITEYYTSEQAALLALAAGADMLCSPEDFTEAYEGLLAAVQDQTIPEARIDASLKRIYRIKYRSKVQEIAASTP